MKISDIEKEMKAVENINIKDCEAHTVFIAVGTGHISSATAKHVRHELSGDIEIIKNAFPFNVHSLSPQKIYNHIQVAQEKAQENDLLFYAISVVGHYHTQCLKQQ